tara:strand:- start:639 stop:995 length:357 start_codon:yes stop_codon:yes gene_type:complete
MEEEPFFVGVKNPTELRRDLLGTSKDIIISLKKYEEIMEMRNNKIRLSIDLHNKNKEIKMLAAQLADVIPKTKLKAELGHTHAAVRSEIKHIREDNVTELDKLEKELASIDKKIGTLE